MMFSIIIPAYKSVFLSEAIESCLCQTYQDFELIIVNDASPEDLDSIVARYDDSRIRYYKNQKNCGAENVVDNWNIALSYCTGDWVICMGDDDRLMPYSLEVCSQLIDGYPNVDVFHARVVQIDQYGNQIQLLRQRKEYETVIEFLYERLNGYSQYIGDFCYRTSTLRSMGGFYKLPLAWGSDDITAIMIATDNGIVHAQLPTFQYRMNDNTISTKGNIRIKLSSYLKHKQWVSQFLMTYSTKSEKDERLKLQCLDILNFSFEKRMKGELLKSEMSNLREIMTCICIAFRYNLISKDILMEFYIRFKALYRK